MKHARVKMIGYLLVGLMAHVAMGACPFLSGMTWVPIDDPGVYGHEGFTGEMSQYETTNAQYCDYLNAALASGDITVSGSYVVGG